jgi:hypothetical protein
MPPKTARGNVRKALTGDGRKKPETAIKEALFGKGSNKRKSTKR